MNCYMTLFSKKGYTLICFDLSPDLEEGGGYVNLRKTGTV